MIRAISAFFLLFCCCVLATAKDVSVTSPNGKIRVTLADNDANGHVNPVYRVSYTATPVVNESRLGLVFKKHRPFIEGFSIKSVKKASRDSTWEQPWGERRYVRDHHNEIVVEFARDSRPDDIFFVRVRVFDDGLGFRYEVPKRRGFDKITIVDERTEFAFDKPADTRAWWIPSRGWNRYEYLYNTTTLAEIDRAHTPLTMKLPSGVHISLHEAALVDYAAMTLDQRRPGVFEADLTPWSDGTKVKVTAPFYTPWRTIQIAPDAIGLLNSDLILNLNDPNKLGDVSWVEPGKYIGIWWGMHLGLNTWGSGEKHGATTAETKRFMDFAARHGFDGVLVEGWNLGWDGSWFHNGDVFSFTHAYPDFDLADVAAYGQAKGVRLIGHHETSGSVTNYRKQMGAAYDLYEKHGIRQIKTGYVADGGDIKRVDQKGVARFEWHDGQFMVGEYLHSVKEAAKRKISINTHEPVKDTGLRRTYPNWITREGARGQEFNAWGSPPNTPEHTAILPYTRMLSGPMDFTPGIFDLAPEGLDAENRVKTTLAKQLALYVVLYSPIQMAADLLKNYEARPKAFRFILDVPSDWEQSLALAGEVGDFVVFARKARSGNEWYLGALTDEIARSIPVELSFLDEGKRYKAQIYRDGPDADWLTKPYDIVIEEKLVDSRQTLGLRLATSGGTAIRFVPVTK